jgi:phosphatidylserine decarboxylase
MSDAQSFIGSIRDKLVPIRPEGFPFIGILVFVALFFGWFWQPILWIGLILAAWCAYFFRDPPRVTPLDEAAVVSPADGRVVLVSLGVAPKALGLGEQLRRRVAISLGLFDCHVNRAPMAGTVRRIAYQPGKLFGADDKAADGRERNGIVLDTANGPIGVVQIAGLAARRIVCFTREGAALAAGERVGMIRFGSRVELYLPVSTAVLVAEGQTAVAGETVIARFGADAQGAARRVRVD